MSKYVEIGPVYGLGPCLALFAGVAYASLLAATRCRLREPPCVAARNVVWNGILLGMLALLIGAVWLGVPWGITWLQLLPTPRRGLLALTLAPMILPPALALARALQRLVGDGRPLFVAVAWFTVAVVLWLTNHVVVEPRYPLFTIPLQLTVASFLFPLPLWAMRYRAGATVARGISHAGALAWLLACHLPFVRSG
jgi:hypothetical protein